MSRGECNRLDDYLLGGLPEVEAAGFEAHLADCPACCEQLQQQMRIDHLLGQAAGQLEPVPSSLIDRIEAQYYRSRRRRVVRWACGVSAAAVAASVLGVWLAWGVIGAHDRSARVVQEHPQPAGDAEQLVPGGPEPPRPRSVARVTLDDPSEAVLVPLKTQQPNISIVWVYPTVKPAQTRSVPGNDWYPSPQ